MHCTTTPPSVKYVKQNTLIKNYLLLQFSNLVSSTWLLPSLTHPKPFNLT